MPHLKSHQSVGAGLASAALVSGVLAVSLGWMSPGVVPGRIAPVLPMADPGVVRVSGLIVPRP